MAIDTKWLAEKAAGGMVDPARRCVCGYSLVGLKVNARCPECGRLIPLASGQKAHLPKFTHYPAPVLARLARSTSLMAYGMGGIAIGYMLLWFCRGGRAFGVDTSSALSLLIMVLTVAPGSLAWWLGAVLLAQRDDASDAGSSRGGPADLLADHAPWFRWALTLGQALWPLAALAAMIGLFIEEAKPLTGDVLLLSAIGSAILASPFMTPVCLVLKDLAYHANDDYALNRFRGLAFGIPLVALLFALFPAMHLVIGMSRLITFIAMMCLSLLLTPPAYLMLAALWSIASTCRWARLNAASAEEATERFRERAAQTRRGR